MNQKQKLTIGKSFRLFDFHVYDKNQRDEEESNSDSEASATSEKVANKRLYPSEIPFVIQMFGINESGETCSIYINDYEPFFYAKVGDDWSNSTVREFLIHLKNLKDIKYYSGAIVSAELVEQRKLYGFTGGKNFKFAKITFKNIQTFNKVKNLWYQNDPVTGFRKLKPYIYSSYKLELYESNIPPLLRYFHINNISPSGWVVINTKKCTTISGDKKTTTCKYEYACSISAVVPAPEKESRVPYKVCSFDIEASSSHGDFPVPVKTYKRLAANIVDIFILHSAMDTGSNIDANIDKYQKLLIKIIMAAFEYDRFDDVDTVYPIKKPSKKVILQLSEIFAKTPITDIKYSELADKTDTAMTIERLFDQMKQEQSEKADVLKDDGDNSDNENDAPIIYKKYVKKVKPTKKAILIDIILNPDYDRDEKIQLTNEMLCKTYPKLKGDEVTFIGSTFTKYGDTVPYLNHCIAVGDCDPVDGAVIECSDTESELLLRWTQLIQEENPDIIIGYNIFGFDYEFMFRRAQENYCENEFLLLSRKVNELCANERVDQATGERTMNLENTKVVLASGEYDLRYPKMSGRVQIDLYSYFRRDFNFSSYKLDDVAADLISDNISYVFTDEAADETHLYSQNLAGLNTHDFIHIEVTGFSSDYYKDGKKFRVKNIQRDILYKNEKDGNEENYNVITISGVHKIADDTAGKKIKWGMSKDDVSPQDIFRLSKGSAADRAIVAKYCIQDCNLVHHLMNKTDVITGYVEMSRICSVPISFLVFRGQGIKLTSYVAKKCRDFNTLIPDLDRSGGNEGYEGAIVLPPKTGIYIDNPVGVGDFSSLYPSLMISQNYSHDSKVWTKKYDLEGNLISEWGSGPKHPVTGEYIYDNLPEYEYIHVEFDDYKYLRNPANPKAREVKTKVGKIICCWAQLPDEKKSIMPSILEELLKARSDTRKQAKGEKDPFMQNILDKRQLGYKVTANSLYGQCGAKTSTFYEKDVAACTTASGRLMITYVKRVVEEVYGDLEYQTKDHGLVKCNAEYVYGDSVAEYTPISIRYNQETIDICTIESLASKYGDGIWKPCLEEGKQEKEVCELHNIESWSSSGWTPLFRVIRHQLAHHKKMIRVLTHTGLVDVTDDHSLLLANGTEISPKDCIIGTELLHNSLPIDTDILNNPSIKLSDNINDVSEMKCVNQLTAARIAFLFKNFTITQHSDVITVVKDQNIKPSNKIISIQEIEYTGYVYDLTTENHHFAAGVGNLIVHNTDSVFFTFNLVNPVTQEKIIGKNALAITIEISQDATELCSDYLKPPMGFAYEKTFMPFILLSKKRYVGILYEEDPNKGKLKSMGLVLKRRDNCDLVKDVYGGVLNILMKQNNIEVAIDYLNKCLTDLIDGNIGMDKLTITKALRGYYKNPQSIAHKVLADRIGKRDPGNKPKPGDRMKYVYFVNAVKKALQGEKIETPDYIIENGLKIDYTHYITNQLMKPLQQLFGLALEQIWESQKKTTAIRAYKKEMTSLRMEYSDLEEFNKKKEKYCSAKVKVLLFDKFLTKIFNAENKVQTITDCWKR